MVCNSLSKYQSTTFIHVIGNISCQSEQRNLSNPKDSGEFNHNHNRLAWPFVSLSLCVRSNYAEYLLCICLSGCGYATALLWFCTLCHYTHYCRNTFAVHSQCFCCTVARIALQIHSENATIGFCCGFLLSQCCRCAFAYPVWLGHYSISTAHKTHNTFINDFTKSLLILWFMCYKDAVDQWQYKLVSNAVSLKAWLVAQCPRCWS